MKVIIRRKLICLLIIISLIGGCVFFVSVKAHNAFVQSMLADDGNRYMTDNSDCYSSGSSSISLEGSYYSSSAGYITASFCMSFSNGDKEKYGNRFYLVAADIEAVTDVIPRSDKGDKIILDFYAFNCSNSFENKIYLYDRQASDKPVYEFEVHDSIFDCKYKVIDGMIYVTPFVTVLEGLTVKKPEEIGIKLKNDIIVTPSRIIKYKQKLYLYYDNEVIDNFNIKYIEYKDRDYAMMKGYKISNDPVTASQQFLRYVNYKEINSCEYSNWSEPRVKSYSCYKEASENVQAGDLIEYTGDYLKSGTIYSVTYTDENNKMPETIIYLDKNYVVFGEG